MDVDFEFTAARLAKIANNNSFVGCWGTLVRVGEFVRENPFPACAFSTHYGVVALPCRIQDPARKAYVHSRSLLEEMIAIAKALQEDVQEWIRANHGELLLHESLPNHESKWHESPDNHCWGLSSGIRNRGGFEA